MRRLLSTLVITCLCLGSTAMSASATDTASSAPSPIELDQRISPYGQALAAQTDGGRYVVWVVSDTEIRVHDSGAERMRTFTPPTGPEYLKAHNWRLLSARRGQAVLGVEASGDSRFVTLQLGTGAFGPLITMGSYSGDALCEPARARDAGVAWVLVPCAGKGGESTVVMSLKDGNELWAPRDDATNWFLSVDDPSGYSTLCPRISNANERLWNGMSYEAGVAASPRWQFGRNKHGHQGLVVYRCGDARRDRIDRKGRPLDLSLAANQVSWLHADVHRGKIDQNAHLAQLYDLKKRRLIASYLAAASTIGVTVQHVRNALIVREVTVIDHDTISSRILLVPAGAGV